MVRFGRVTVAASVWSELPLSANCMAGLLPPAQVLLMVVLPPTRSVRVEEKLPDWNTFTDVRVKFWFTCRSAPRTTLAVPAAISRLSMVPVKVSWEAPTTRTWVPETLLSRPAPEREPASFRSLFSSTSPPVLLTASAVTLAVPVKVWSAPPLKVSTTAGLLPPAQVLLTVIAPPTRNERVEEKLADCSTFTEVRVKFWFTCRSAPSEIPLVPAAISRLSTVPVKVRVEAPSTRTWVPETLLSRPAPASEPASFRSLFSSTSPPVLLTASAVTLAVPAKVWSVLPLKVSTAAELLPPAQVLFTTTEPFTRSERPVEKLDDSSTFTEVRVKSWSTCRSEPRETLVAPAAISRLSIAPDRLSVEAPTTRTLLLVPRMLPAPERKPASFRSLSSDKVEPELTASAVTLPVPVKVALPSIVSTTAGVLPRVQLLFTTTLPLELLLTRKVRVVEKLVDSRLLTAVSVKFWFTCRSAPNAMLLPGALIVRLYSGAAQFTVEAAVIVTVLVPAFRAPVAATARLPPMLTL